MLFSRIRAWFVHPTLSSRRKALFDEQHRLYEGFLRKTRHYEQKLEKLERALLHASDEVLERERHFFEEALTRMKELLERWELGDQDTETLLREWRAWEKHASSSREKMLAAELHARGISVAPSHKPQPATTLGQKKKTRLYHPVALAEDVFDEVKRVYASRVKHATIRADKLLTHLHAHAAHVSNPASLAHRVRRVHEQVRRWRKGVA